MAGSYLARSIAMIQKYQSEVGLCCDSLLPDWLKQFNKPFLYPSNSCPVVVTVNLEFFNVAQKCTS